MTPQSAHSRVYTDFNGLANLKSQARAESPEAIKQVAKEFEASFVQMMMKSLRDASMTEGGIMDNDATRMYQDMFDKQISVDISERGDLGIAEVIERQLTKQTGQDSALNEKNAVIATASPTLSEKTANTKSVMPSVTPGISGFGPAHQLTTAQKIRLSRHSNPVNAHDPFNTGSSALIADSTPFDLRRKATSGIHAMSSGQPLIDLQQNTGHLFNTRKGVNTETAQSNVQVTLRDPAVLNRTRFETPEEFIETLRPHAERAADELGVNPDILIAQAALETGWGKKVIRHANGESSYNLFGIKANRSWEGDSVRVGSLEYRNGKARREVSPFRSYDSFAESFQDYVRFIKDQPRYGEAIEKAGNSRSYIRELQQAGYATDPNYAKKVINIMERRSLQDAWRA